MCVKLHDIVDYLFFLGNKRTQKYGCCSFGVEAFIINMLSQLWKQIWYYVAVIGK